MTQENDNAKEKKMNNNEFKLGDKVVWNFVFDEADESGVVVGVHGDKVEVEYKGWNGRMYRDMLSVDEVMLEEKYLENSF